MIKKIQFTKKGYEKVEKDFQDLTEKRKTAVFNLQKARELGDLSENGAYKAARFELSGIDRELRRLKYLLRFGSVTESEHQNKFIDFGNIVTIKNLERVLEFMLVGPFESNPKSGSLSVHSPIGKAIVGHKVGDIVTVFAPSGKVEWEIIKIA